VTGLSSHLIVAPILLPLATGALLLLLERYRPRAQGAVSIVATLLLAWLAIALLALADEGPVRAYLDGNWKAPFGIVLVLDRLSAMMLVLVALLAIGSGVASLGGLAARGPHYAAFFQFQLAGLNGAFLTGDLFNLFVFFELLLIASYALLLHGAGGRTLREGFRYVVVNLVGSTLFLVGASLVYGAAGTLNLADLALRLPALAAAPRALTEAALMLLFGVFAVKAAVLPFGFWMPSTYASAPPAVAALFGIMTKVGVYAILRVSMIVWAGGANSGFAEGFVPVAVTLGVLTVVYGVSVALASSGLAGIVAGLVAVSSGSLIATAAASPDHLGGVLYYLAHSTLVAATLFLLAGAIAGRRGARGDQVDASPWHGNRTALGAGFFVAAVAVAGLPPLSGFVGKVQMMGGVQAGAYATVVWSMLLASGLAATVALSRAGSRIFWKASSEGPTTGAAAGSAPERIAIGAMLLLLALLALGAGPVSRYANDAAAQLAAPAAYVDAVMRAAPVPSPEPAR
jgi:multicomponent K+:H+ antiporter subunit D